MRSRLERELSKWVDRKMEELGDLRHYGTQLTDSEAIDSKLSDIEFRDQFVEAVIKLLSEAIRCKKVSEALSRAGIKEEYEIKVEISADEFSVGAPLPSRK